MIRKAIWFGSTLLLAGAVLLAAPGAGQAQRGGHGGGHFGGGHFGGGFGGARFGGYHGGFYRGGYGYSHAYPHFGYRNYYPYYGLYGYSPSYYDTYPYAWSDPGYTGSYTYVAPSYPDSYATVTPPASGYQSYYYAPAQPDRTAHVTVNVPPNAQVWFEGVKTTSTGAVREYQSPSLKPGSRYTYEVRARWMANGKEVTQTQRVGVTAGARVNVRFPEAAAQTGGKAPAVTRK
jgi:uncharacterized protein (TIGR03000 family)